MFGAYWEGFLSKQNWRFSISFVSRQQEKSKQKGQPLKEIGVPTLTASLGFFSSPMKGIQYLDVPLEVSKWLVNRL